MPTSFGARDREASVDLTSSENLDAMESDLSKTPLGAVAADMAETVNCFTSQMASLGGFSAILAENENAVT